MNHFTYANMRRLASDIQGDMSSVSSQSVCTFEEVYNNLENLDGRLGTVEAAIGGIPYDPQTKTLTIVSPVGTYDSSTKTITFITM